MSTWQERIKAAIGTRGYENCMRRSLQTVVLYEAKRCISPRLPSLRPFQRKAVFLDQAQALLESLDFLFPHQKAEILWRTASSKETMDADIAWKREKGVSKEILSLQKKMTPLVAKAKTHDEAMTLLIQSLYESLTSFSGKPFPHNWDHAHNHCILAYRMYYRFDKLDATFPDPVSPREIDVPMDRPKNMRHHKMGAMSHVGSSGGVGGASDGEGEPHLDVAELLGESKSAEQDRRKVLQEVREHLELLKEFDGVIPEEDLAKRKRDLFLALPAAPPPATACPMSATKKPKLSADV